MRSMCEDALVSFRLARGVRLTDISGEALFNLDVQKIITTPAYHTAVFDICGCGEGPGGRKAVAKALGLVTSPSAPSDDYTLVTVAALNAAGCLLKPEIGAKRDKPILKSHHPGTKGKDLMNLDAKALIATPNYRKGIYDQCGCRTQRDAAGLSSAAASAERDKRILKIDLPAARRRGVIRCVAASPGNGGQAPRLFVFGLGYTGLEFAQQARQRLGAEVFGTCRSEGKAEALQAVGITAFPWDIDDGYQPLEGEALEALESATHLLSTMSPFADFSKDPVVALLAKEDPVLVLHGKEVLQRCTNLQWAGYLSTTSVYGDHSGAWVDEESETRVTDRDPSAMARLAAEGEWLALAPHIPVHVFRLAGIYGPFRGIYGPLRYFSSSSFIPLKPGDE
ncbi:hypothetical protein T484DRAFT_1819238 [Baffinella frigidus]|nr:hypothetical protein T484DRAFT_1819238 [Cryptophyta sp. CCMP2293]